MLLCLSVVLLLLPCLSQHLLKDCSCTLQNSDSKTQWVHGLRYVKSYWSKRKVRETILSEEKERELLARILREEEDEDDDREVGHVTVM